MTRPGPRPKPPELRVLHGDRKDRQKPRAPKPPARDSVPAPPAWLSVRAKTIWRRKAKQLHAVRLLTDWDLEQFAVYCEAIVNHQDAAKQIRGHLTIDAVNPRGKRRPLVKHPAFQVYRDTAVLIRLYAQEFGLTPSARSGVEVADDGDDSDADRLLS